MLSASRCGPSASRSGRLTIPSATEGRGSRGRSPRSCIGHVHPVPRRHPRRRVVSHRLADESLAPIEPGSRVALSWEPEQASVLAGLGLRCRSPSLRFRGRRAAASATRRPTSAATTTIRETLITTTAHSMTCVAGSGSEAPSRGRSGTSSVSRRTNEAPRTRRTTS